MTQPRLLDLFCGRGGWSKAFIRRGWHCVGVDIANLGFPGEFLKCSVWNLTPDFIAGFDGVVSSPPCEEFARAWLPWLTSKGGAAESLKLLKWSIALCNEQPRRITECSRFAARYVPDAIFCNSYALWGDVPVLLPEIPRRKMMQSGMRPDLRAEIPPALADCVAGHFTRQMQSAALTL